MSLSLRTAAALWLLTGALVGLVVAAGAVLDQPIGNLTRDPQAILGAPWYYGFLSNVGVLVWWGTAVALVLVGGIVWRLGSRRSGQIVIGVGLFSAWLALDDLLLMHEDFLPRTSFLSEELILAVYAVVTLGVLWSVRPILHRDTRFLLSLALAFFFASILVDLYGSWADTTLYLYEDTLKLFGIVTWSATFVFASLRLLSEAILLASEARDPTIRVTNSSQAAEKSEGIAAR